MANNDNAIQNRRVFGIISHPDAGKTTLTETLLLHGGVIREAGVVKARRGKFATSDWMAIEKQRGISVTSSVMQFEYDGKTVSIMDTPGHNDFGEDTYRILTSVDSAVMVIDAAKGVEAQTKKLFKVCKQREIPVFTFMNKLDRQAKDPLELLQELEDALGLPSVAITWPIGSGLSFQGVYDREHNRVLLTDGRTLDLDEEGVNSPALEGVIEQINLENLRSEIELLDGAGNPFSKELVDAGLLSPVFFGTALQDFGVTPFLEFFLTHAPAPGPRQALDGPVYPTDPFFSGFIFKIQANMNPAHRDRLAFLRVCSGTFHRGMTATLTRTGKAMKLSQATYLMANERETVEEAGAGEVIGIYDTGNFAIGDTLTDRKTPLAFEPLPTFPPELFCKVRPTNSLKAKHFQKGVEQLTQEGAIQVYHNRYQEIILGAVGQLQFEVFQFRLENEYGADLIMEPMDFSVARWVDTQDLEGLRALENSRQIQVFDRYERPVMLFANQYTCDNFAERHEGFPLLEAAELKN